MTHRNTIGSTKMIDRIIFAVFVAAWSLLVGSLLGVLFYAFYLLLVGGCC